MVQFEGRLSRLYIPFVHSVCTAISLDKALISMKQLSLMMLILAMGFSRGYETGVLGVFVVHRDK